MADQSMLQSFIQNTAGTQTAAQANVPTAVNNGNPNTAYNWTSYLPKVTQGAGGLPSVNFNLLASQAPASSAGYTPPFTADPYAAMVMAGMPRAGSNDNVNRILGGFLGGGSVGGGFTPNPGTGTPVTPPTPTTPTTPNTGTGSGWAGAGSFKPVGPISGPIHNNPHSWQSNYANAQPNTNGLDSRQGYNSLPWSSSYNGTAFGAGGSASGDGSPIMDTLRNLGNSLGSTLRGEWSGFVNDITGKNGLAGMLEVIGPALGIPKILISSFMPDPAQLATMSPEQQATLTANMNQQISNLIGKAVDKGGADARARLEGLLDQSKKGALPAGWTNQTMTSKQWKDYQKKFNFVNMFAQGTAGDIGQQLGREAEEKVRQSIARRGNVQR